MLRGHDGRLLLLVFIVQCNYGAAFAHNQAKKWYISGNDSSNESAPGNQKHCYPMKNNYYYNRISEAENTRLNKQYLAWVKWRKSGSVPMNNHGADTIGSAPPVLCLGPSVLGDGDIVLNKSVIYGKRSAHFRQ